MSQNNHVYAMSESPTEPGFYDLPEPFTPLTLEEKRKLIAGMTIPGITDMSVKYEMLSKLGQGTFGTVYKAREKGTNNFVALKKIPINAEYGGIPLTAVREIRILQQLEHNNIVKLIEVCKTNMKAGINPSVFYLTLEFCEHNLEDLLKEKRINFTLAMRKSIIQQILNGLYFMHFSRILHRDIKPANILVTKTGTVKVADFGLARLMSTHEEKSQKPKTNCVVTLWYRAPELLLGDRNYGPSIDIWSVGCLMAELWTRSPILAGNSEKDQLFQIINLCGSIAKTQWPEVEKLPLFNNIELPKNVKRRITERLGRFLNDQRATSLLDELLTLNPTKRTNADKALNHAFFWENPMPCSLESVLAAYRRLKLQVNLPAQAETTNGYVEQIF